MAPEAVRSAIDWSEIGGPLADWKAKRHRVELAGREPLEGREAWAPRRRGWRQGSARPAEDPRPDRRGRPRARRRALPDQGHAAAV